MLIILTIEVPRTTTLGSAIRRVRGSFLRGSSTGLLQFNELAVGDIVHFEFKCELPVGKVFYKSRSLNKPIHANETAPFPLPSPARSFTTHLCSSPTPNLSSQTMKKTPFSSSNNYRTIYAKKAKFNLVVSPTTQQRHLTPTSAI